MVCVNVEGADLAGFGLTDGRISKLVLFYDIAPPLKVNNIRKQIEAHNDKLVKVSIKPISGDKKQSLMVSFEVEPIEFYLVQHVTDPKIAEAMRQHRWIPK